MISMKKIWKRTSAWRGYEQFKNAVGAANDTGSWSDSPCPTAYVVGEINEFKKKLREAGIRFRAGYCRTSNVFCMSRQIVVHERDRERALEIAKQHQKETRYFYACD
jgi:hypothetical protein